MAKCYSSDGEVGGTMVKLEQQVLSYWVLQRSPLTALMCAMWFSNHAGPDHRCHLKEENEDKLTNQYYPWEFSGSTCYRFLWPFWQLRRLRRLRQAHAQTLNKVLLQTLIGQVDAELLKGVSSKDQLSCSVHYAGHRSNSSPHDRWHRATGWRCSLSKP
jgi:hypothetical protein